MIQHELTAFIRIKGQEKLRRRDNNNGQQKFSLPKQQCGFTCGTEGIFTGCTKSCKKINISDIV